MQLFFFLGTKRNCYGQGRLWPNNKMYNILEAADRVAQRCHGSSLLSKLAEITVQLLSRRMNHNCCLKNNGEKVSFNGTLLIIMYKKPHFYPKGREQAEIPKVKEEQGLLLGIKGRPLTTRPPKSSPHQGSTSIVRTGRTLPGPGTIGTPWTRGGSYYLLFFLPYLYFSFSLPFTYCTPLYGQNNKVCAV